MLKFSKKILSKKFFFMKEDEASIGIFENILFPEMESSKLNNYSAIDPTNLLFNYGTVPLGVTNSHLW
jgi:hypothetical protein